MNKPKILIVEDEPLIADDIAMILNKQKYLISNMVDNAQDALDHLKHNEVNLVLLDINIMGDMDGIQLAHRINMDFQVPFIFLTSYYDNNTLKRAKTTHPSGFIVKPFDTADLIANIELASMKSTVKHSNAIEEKFFVRDRKALTSINSIDIVYVESDDNYANIYTSNRKYVVSHTLKSVEEQLSSLDFIRIHKSYLVNFQKISSIHEGYVFLGEIKLSIGRSYKDQLLSRLSIL